MSWINLAKADIVFQGSNLYAFSKNSDPSRLRSLITSPFRPLAVNWEHNKASTCFRCGRFGLETRLQTHGASVLAEKWLLLFIVSCFLPEPLLQHQCTLCSDSPAQKWFVLAYKLAVVFRRRSAKTRVSRPDDWDIQGAEHALQVSGAFGPWRAIDGAYPNPYVLSSGPFTQLHTSGCFTLFFMILILEGMLVPSCRIYSSEPYIKL